MPASFIYPNRSGAWGCGIVLANATETEVTACEKLGRALEHISSGGDHKGNEPNRLAFQVMD